MSVLPKSQLNFLGISSRRTSLFVLMTISMLFISMSLINTKSTNTIKFISDSNDYSKVDKVQANEDIVDYGLLVSDFCRIEGKLIDSNEIEFTVKMSTYGYVGICLGDSMKNTDMIIIEVNQNGDLSVTDRYSEGYAPPSKDEKLGGTNDITNPKITQTTTSNSNITTDIASLYTISFNRKLKTEDVKYDYQIQTLEEEKKTKINKNEINSNDSDSSNSTNSKETVSGRRDLAIVWVKEKSLSYHGDNILFSHIAVSTEKNLVSIGETFLPGTSGDDSHKHKGGYFFDIHGITQIIIWTFVNVPSIIAIRHFKYHPYTKYIHLIAGGLTSIASIVLTAIAINLKLPLRLSFQLTKKEIHNLVGFIHFIMVNANLIFGLVSFFAIYFFTQSKNYVHKFKYVHYVLGYIISSISYISCVTGFMMMYKEYLFIAIIVSIFFPLLFLTFEVYFTLLTNATKQGHLNLETDYLKKYHNIAEISEEQIALMMKNLKNLKKEEKEIIENGNSNIGTLVCENNKKDIPEETSYLDYNSKFNSMRIVFYDNLICNIGDYIDNHPGGNNLLIMHLGKDIGRFLSGTYSGHKNFHAYKHYNQTISYLINNFTIGKLNNKTDELVFRKVISSNKFNDSIEYRDSAECEKRVTCILNSFDSTSIDKISIVAESVYRVSFKIKTSNNSNDLNDPYYYFSKALKGIGYFGKHYSVFSKTLNKTRYYTVCLALNNETFNSHYSLLTKFINTSADKEEDKLVAQNDSINLDNNYNNTEYQMIVEDHTKLSNNLRQNYSQTLDIYLKKYNDKNSMSYQLTNSLFIDTVGEFSISGPLGRGLGFNNNTILSGKHVILSGGTGIFCFLDYILYTFRYMVHLIKQKEKSDSKITSKDDFLNILHKEDFFNVQSDFQLLFFSSFNNQSSSVFHDFCLLLEQFDLKYSLNKFKYYPRFSDTSNFRWNTQYLNEKLTTSNLEGISNINEINKITNIFTAGPLRMIDDLTTSLTQLGLKNKIIEV